MEYTLSETLAIAQVDEYNSTMVTGGVHPADERDGLIDVGFAEFVAMMGAHDGEDLEIHSTTD